MNYGMKEDCPKPCMERWAEVAENTFYLFTNELSVEDQQKAFNEFRQRLIQWRSERINRLEKEMHEANTIRNREVELLEDLAQTPLTKCRAA